MIIAFDLDGTIIEYDGWKGNDVFGVPFKDSMTVLSILKELGDKIIIDTCRLHTVELEKFLNDNDIPYDAINDNIWHDYKQPGDKRKVIADAYVGDNYIRYEGNGMDVLTKLEVIRKNLMKKH